MRQRRLSSNPGVSSGLSQALVFVKGGTDFRGVQGSCSSCDCDTQRGARPRHCRLPRQRQATRAGATKDELDVVLIAPAVRQTRVVSTAPTLAAAIGYALQADVRALEPPPSGLSITQSG